MNKSIYALTFALSLSLSATDPVTYTVNSTFGGLDTTPGTFLFSLLSAGLFSNPQNIVDFNLPLPATIVLINDGSLGNTFTIDGTNGGLGVTISATADNVVESFGAATILTNSSGTMTFNWKLTSEGSTSTLTKQGVGILALGGDNSGYRGTMDLSLGQITVGNNHALGRNTLTMADTTILALNNGINVSNVISITSGTGSIDVEGTDAATLSGNTGATDGILAKTGTGTLVLSGNNAHSGGTTLSAGQITLGDSSGLGTGTLSMADTTILSLNNGINTPNEISITSGTGSIDVDDGNTATFSGATAPTAGILAKTGTGELVLSGANLHTGGTALSAGQITLGNNAGLGGYNFTMEDSTVLAFNNDINASNDIVLNGSAILTVDSGTGTFSGQILTTANGLTKTGAGILVLSGNNQYSGATNLNAGTISFGGAGALGSGQLNMTGGTTLSIPNAMDATNGVNIISGTANFSIDSGTGSFSGSTLNTAGTVAKTGSGNLILSGTNLHMGGTNLSQGMLSVKNNNALGNGLLTMAGGTTLIIDSNYQVSNDVILNGAVALNVGSGTATFAGQILATSNGFTKTGAGTLVLSQDNLYTGVTTLSAGQITVGSDSALGSNALNMANSTLLSISNGILVSNTVTMTGASGSLVVSYGTGSLSGAITGASGGTVKSGAGNFVLAAGGTFLGNLSVTEGTFTVNGVFTGDVSATSGTTVKGTGTIENSLTIGSGAAITPGNSIGTITVGSLDLTAGSVTNIELNPTSNSLIDVVGTANIAGNVNVIQNAGSYQLGKSYEILNAGTLAGEFNPIVTGGFSNFIFSINYIGNTANLTYDLFIDTDGLSGNILTFADYLKEYAPHSQGYYVLAQLSGETLANGINSLSPARNFTGTLVASQTMFSFSHVLNEYLCDKRLLSLSSASQSFADNHQFFEESLVSSDGNVQCRKKTQKNDGSKNEFWMAGFGDVARQDAKNQNAAFDFYTFGVLLGFDRSFIEEFVFGGVLGYANSQISTDGNMGTAYINYGIGSLYGYYLWEDLYLEGAVWGGYNQVKNHRAICFGNVQRNALSTVNNWQLTPHIELGWLLKHKGKTMKPYIEPHIAFDYVTNWQGGYAENGAGDLNMHCNAQTSSMLQTEVGVRFFKEVENASVRFGFKEGLSFINRVPFDTGTITTAIFGATELVTLTSFRAAQNLAAVTAELLIQPKVTRDLTVAIGYQGQFGVEYIFNEVSLRLQVQF